MTRIVEHEESFPNEHEPRAGIKIASNWPRKSDRWDLIRGGRSPRHWAVVIDHKGDLVTDASTGSPRRNRARAVILDPQVA
jgi:hypothetical protein